MERNKTILLVEDSDKDAELICLALSGLEIPIEVDRVRDGVEAMEYLHGRKESVKNTTLVLLDIKLPRINGIEVLTELKTDEGTKCIPVVMLTSSREECDISQCYRAGASAYVVKPLEFNDLIETLRCTGRFWCAVNEAPV